MVNAGITLRLGSHGERPRITPHALQQIIINQTNRLKQQDELLKQQEDKINNLEQQILELKQMMVNLKNKKCIVTQTDTAMKLSFIAVVVFGGLNWWEARLLIGVFRAKGPCPFLKDKKKYRVAVGSCERRQSQGTCPPRGRTASPKEPIETVTPIPRMTTFLRLSREGGGECRRIGANRLLRISCRCSRFTTHNSPIF